MLRHLYVRNLVLIDELSLHFGEGFNVITGETGTGKTVLVESLHLIAGGRAASSVIRNDQEEGEVIAEFDVPADHALHALLKEQSLETDDSPLIIRRHLSRDGRSRVYVNDRPVTVGLLKDMGAYLVDISGQHEHQRLLQPQFHLAMLDEYGHLTPRRRTVGDAFKKLRDLTARLEDMESRSRNRAQREDFLSYQVREIEALDLHPGEDDELHRERSLLRNIETIRSGVSEAEELLYTGDDSAYTRTGRSIALLENASRKGADALSEALSMLRDAEALLSEAAHSASSLLRNMESDPGRLEAVEARLSAIDLLKRKHGATLEDILHNLEDMHRELDDIRHFDEDRSALEKAIAAQRRSLAAEARKLSEQRTKTAQKLSRAVTAQLRDLAMPSASFSVAVVPLSPSATHESCDDIQVSSTGMDDVAFLFTANKGQDMQPIDAVASGGELSRLMLSVKIVLRAAHPPLTLLFDEIDAGIGGETARAVGSKMAELSALRQVLCVTHLPQIAALGKRHYVVNKRETADSTVTSVAEVHDGDRVEEIARMLAGDTRSEKALQHASELLNAS